MRLLEGEGGPRTAVIEMARAGGLARAGGAERNDPIAATTRGVGELILAAINAECRRIIVGCGGSATSDGGAGALEVLTPDDLDGIELLVACDVDTTFLDAARVFGPQKGAGPDEVTELSTRLIELGRRYLDEYGVDVRDLRGAGAAGGLGGALAALGGQLVSGFDLFATIVGFPNALIHADLVVTGEGRLDPTSLEGKVVGEVVTRAHGRTPVLVIVGSAEHGILAGRDDCRVIDLCEQFGRSAAFEATADLITRVVSNELRAIGWP